MYSGSHLKSNGADISVSANDHEEEDSRIYLHVDDALNDGQLLFCVVVILVGVFHDLVN